MNEQDDEARKMRNHTDKDMYAMLGWMAGMFSKALLESIGHRVDYTINGIPIQLIDKLGTVDLKEQLDIAVKEERYEDCIILREKIKALSLANNSENKKLS